MYQNIYNQTVTILNKLKRADTDGSSDVWYKRSVTDAAWYAQVQRTVTAGNVAIGSYIVVMIPYHEEYVRYRDWKNLSASERVGKFTMSTGDYLVLGNIDEAEASITPSNITTIVNEYEPDVCQIKHLEELHDRFGSYVQLRIEGA